MSTRTRIGPAEDMPQGLTTDSVAEGIAPGTQKPDPRFRGR